jgi:MarR family transcriptional regulator for hemolysin
MKQSDPKREAGLRIIETSRLLRTLVDQRLRPYGMTRVQFATLSKLEWQDGLAQYELADMLEVQPIVIVKLLDQLSADGLIERRQDPADRRCNRLFITDAGRARLGTLAGFKAELGAEVFAGIANSDLTHLLATLDQLHQNIKQIQAADSSAKPRKAQAS